MRLTPTFIPAAFFAAAFGLLGAPAILAADAVVPELLISTEK